MRLFPSGPKRIRFRRMCATLTAAIGMVALLAPVPADAGESWPCQDRTYSVQIPLPEFLMSVLSEQGSMYGHLCSPPGAKTLAVLIPGGTYNSSYWDIGYLPQDRALQSRSFQMAMYNAGIATLAVDRLGTGHSSKPPSVLLTASSQAATVHQVIGKMRSQYDKVIVGGHSIGSAMALIEAGTYRDVDGVFTTGFTHGMNYTVVAPTLAKMTPAAVDPVLGNKYRDLKDLAYLTTSPGSRYQDFHTPGPRDPDAITYDEDTKDVFAATEAVDVILLNSQITPISQRITVPVMVVQGDDPNYCGPPLGATCTSGETLRRSEAPYYPKSPRLSAYVLHGYGHSINYAPNAPEYYKHIADWLHTL